MKIGLRADGGHEIGYGHLVRVCVLSREFEEHGHETIFFTKNEEPLEDISQQDLEIEKISGHDDFLSRLEKGNIDHIVSDSYEINTEKQRAIRDRVDLYAAISDDTRFPFSCDILINGNIYAEDLQYDLADEEPKCLLGTDYIILREEFRKAAQEKSQSQALNSVLVMMGGGDTNNFTPKVMELLKKYSIQIEVIIGPGFQNEERIRDLAEESDKFNLHFNPNKLAEIMKQSDIAISATGTSVYELIATETPFIGIPQTANQGPVADSIEQENLGIIAQENELEGSIDKLISDDELREKIRKKQRGFIDGLGPKRIRKKIEKYGS